MNLFVTKYSDWLQKMDKTLICSKGSEGNVLLSRFQSLTLREDLLGARFHAHKLLGVVSNFSEGKQNLRWLAKLERDCQQWVEVFESLVRASMIETDEVLQALLNEEIDIDFATSLVRS